MLQNKDLYQALIAGAVYDKKLGKWVRHKDLLNHLDLEIRKLWTGDGEKEFGRLTKDTLTPRGRIS